MQKEINHKEVLLQAEAFVKNYFETEMPKDYYYHSFAHTKDVVNAAAEIATNYKMTEMEVAGIQLAAWFHDLGYGAGAEGHEQRGVDMLRSFASNLGFEGEMVDKMADCIGATKMGTNPDKLMSMILADADLCNLGTKSFFHYLDMLRTELQLTQNKTFTDEEWLKYNIDFVSKHEYLTPVAKSMYNERKLKNLEQLKADLAGYTKSKKNVSRGVETMYRVTLRNQTQLSKIADNKANIMLSVTAIMLSLVLSSLVPKLDSNTELILPTVITIGVCILTMFFAIMAIRPIITSGKFSKEDFLDKKINLLFFGNFYKLDLKTFEWGMDRMMEDDDLLYSSLSKDLYFLGIVLSKKYMYLQMCYIVFMLGVVISAAAYISVLLK